MIRSSHERFIEARSEQVWLVVDDSACLARWLAVSEFCGVATDADTVIDGSVRSITWSSVPEPPQATRSTSLTVEVIPEESGTRVRLLVMREPQGVLRGLATKRTAQRSLERQLRRSLDQLATMLVGRQTA
jgi:uncharacterized membrane protein